tara:strand:- start:1780 stop:1998 length:219 start_codon:yes stop_codon:yes gene_type:complete
MLFQEIEGSFAEEVEKLASTTGSYIDSVIQLCENYNIEPQVAAKMLTKPIVEKIEAEGRESNSLPKVSTLPI